MSAHFSIIKAQSPEDRLKAFRLRHQVLVKELGWNIPATDSFEAMSEPADDQSTILLALSDQQPVGTVALDWGRKRIFDPTTILHYQLQWFLEDWPPERIALARKLLVAEGFRGGRTHLKLLIALYECLVEENIQFCLLDCSPRLIRYYERFGARRYAPYFAPDDTGVLAVPLVFLPFDLERLRLTNAPYLAIAKTRNLPDAPAVRSWAQEMWGTECPDGKDLPFFATGDQPLVPSTRLTLADIPLFAMVPPDVINKFEETGQYRTATPREAIIRHEAPADALYLLLDGYAEVITPRTGGTVSVATLGPGDLFGEIGFFTQRPRNATVVALTSCEVFRIPNTQFERLAQNDSKGWRLYKNLASIVAHRLRATTHWVNHVPL
jgi:hypothetical protein